MPQDPPLVNQGKKCLNCTACLSVLLIIASFGAIGPRQYGIVVDNNFCDVDEVVWKSGVWFNGLRRNFIRFPKGYVTFQFTSDGSLNNEDYDPWAEGGDVTSGVVSCWTRTGQQVDLEISLQVKMRSESVMDLYWQWETFEMGKLYLQAMIVAAIKNQAVLIPMEYFFTDREIVMNLLMDKIQSVLDESFYTLEKFQLRKVALPGPFENAILQKLLVFQSQKLAQYKQNELIIRSRINQVTQKAEADALITLENATAQGNRKVEVATINGMRDLIVARANGFKQLVDDLKLVNPELENKGINFAVYAKLCKMSAAAVEEVVGFKDSSMVSIN
jgi:hypothetical protein